MRRLTLAAALLIAFVMSAWAEDAPNDAIRDTIQNQIEAFKVDDFATAFGFASPSIQSMFRTPENFGAMVRNGFPMVWRPRSVDYGTLRSHGGALWQQVTIIDETGVTFQLAYRMEQSDTGWKIAGVVILDAPDLSA